MPDASPHRGLLIVLAYLWPLALVPLVVAKDDPDVRWHARHGIVLTIAEALLILVYLTTASFVDFAAFGLGGVMLILVVLAWIAMLAVHIAAVFKGVNGERLKVPWVSARLP